MADKKFIQKIVDIFVDICYSLPSLRLLLLDGMYDSTFEVYTESKNGVFGDRTLCWDTEISNIFLINMLVCHFEIRTWWPKN